MTTELSYPIGKFKWEGDATAEQRQQLIDEIAGTPARVLLKMLDAYLAWDEKRRQRLALLALSDEILKDIGISRAQAEAEGSKPFWRD